MVKDAGVGRGAGEEAGLAAESPAPRKISRRVGLRRGDSSKRYSVADKLALLAELESSGETFERFCARRGVSSASLCKWKRKLEAMGEAGLADRITAGNRTGRRGRVHSPEERRRAVEAFAQSDLTVRDFARTFGLSTGTLSHWLARYRELGPKGLEPRPHGPRRRARDDTSSTTATSAAPATPGAAHPTGVHAEIVRTKLRFPDFGLRRVRDFLARFQGIFVSTGTVARALDASAVERAAPQPPRRRHRELPRRFERALANDLWQTDITSFVIGRSRLRVYLIVFLDDFSRFVVSHGLYVYQRGDIAKETLLVGVGRFGKPREVLSDQGRQYFAWRGKSEFQKLLWKLGIGHVVARAHHPETVGKCERLWETVKREFVERVELEDVGDARERIGHYIAHYNFFRPHQGIGGLVPADRYFGAEEALRRTHEKRLAADELSLALSSAPRTGAYLFGQIGDEQVSVHGERGSLVVQTSSGVRQRIGLEGLGAPASVPAGSKEVPDDDSDPERRGASEPDDGGGGGELDGAQGGSGAAAVDGF